MSLHTTFAYVEAATAAGKEFTYVETNESQIRPFENEDFATLLGLYAGIDTVTREAYIDFYMKQDPSFKKNEIAPVCQFDAIGVNQNVYFPIGAKVQRVSRDLGLYGYDAAGGALKMAVGLLMRYGNSLGIYDWNNPPAMDVIRDRIHLNSDLTAKAWTTIGTVTNLDPDRIYGFIGGKLIPEDKMVVGARLNVAGTGCKPGITPGPEIHFPEIAAIVRGDENPSVEGFAIEATECEAELIFLDMGPKPSRMPNTTFNQGQATNQPSTGLFSLM